LPDYLRGFDVALLPCPLNDYTRSMFPMKFFEYLAAGVPVVATDLPALCEYRHLARLCVTRRDFLVAVDELLLCRQRAESRSSAIPLDQLPECCSYQARTRSMLLELQGRLSQADRLR
jgi:glycosyltransferase involved in cell wall biosynthesis